MLFKKKNVELIKFLGILKKYVSENKINFCSEKEGNVSLNKKVTWNLLVIQVTYSSYFKVFKLFQIISVTGSKG